MKEASAFIGALQSVGTKIEKSKVNAFWQATWNNQGGGTDHLNI